MLEDFFRKPFTFDRVARITFVVLLIILFFWGVKAIATLLIPFGLAWMTAYLLMPVVYFLEKKLKIKFRALSIFIVVLLLLGILTGVFSLLIPSIIEETKKAWELVQYYDVGGLLLGLVPDGLKTQSEFYSNIEELIASINIQEFISSVQDVFTRSWKIVQSTLSYLSGLVVVFLFLAYLIFIMYDYEILVDGFFKLSPRSIRPFLHELADNIEFYINSYFRGQALISLCCGVILAIGFAIMGLPMGITFGLFLGLLNMIPYLQYIGYFPMVFLVGLQAAVTNQNFFVILLFAVIVILISEVVQQVILTPMIHGKTMGIRPAVILLSLTVWGTIFGFLGLLFALPLTMILYTFYMKYIIGEPIENGPLISDDNRKDFREILKKFEIHPEKHGHNKKADQDGL